MKPYYQTDDGSIRIFHARWEDVLAAGVFKPKDIALVHADPPYGINVDMDGGAARRKASNGNALGRVHGDDKPFDPTELLALGRPLVAWGANNFAAKLPASSAWWIWDKRVDMPSDDRSDCEMAWTNIGASARVFRCVWKGTVRDVERGPTLHPTQKPEALSAWVFAHAIARKKLKKGDTILVPYMGSGPDLRPAQAMGLRVIACEVAEEYCKTAVNARLRAVAKPIENAALGPLFGAL